MTTAHPIKTNFTSGELSPRLMGRTDVSKYVNGAECVENFIILVAGGLLRRQGTRFIAHVHDSDERSALKSFMFNTRQAYSLEFYPGGLRFYMNDKSQLISYPCTVQFVNGGFDANLASWTASGVTWDAGKAKFNAAGNYIEQKLVFTADQDPVSLYFDVIGEPGDYVTLTIGTAAGGTQIATAADFKTGSHLRTFDTNGATDVYLRWTFGDSVAWLDNVRTLDDEPIYLSAPYLEDELLNLHTAQSADVMYIAHSAHEPYRLERYGHGDWSLRAVEFSDGPYQPKNLDPDFKLAVGAITGNGITVTASGTGNKPFKAADVGRFLTIRHNRTQAQVDAEVNPWGYGLIKTYVSPTQITIDVYRDFLKTDASDEWALGAWDDETGFPTTVSIYEERAWWAGSQEFPLTAWSSKSGDWENMGPGAEPSDAITYTVSTDQVNGIAWLSPGKTLVMGTSGAEMVVRAADINEAVTPDNIVVKCETRYGSAEFQPVRVDQVVLFPQRARRKLREFVYSFEVDGFVSNDLTIMADHILRPGFSTMAYQQEPGSVVWIPRDDGVLACLTYLRAQEVVGWSRCKLGGRCDTLNYGVVESVCTIPTEDHDEVWFVVRRTVNGQTVRHIEVLENEFWTEDPSDKSACKFLDSHLTYDGPPTSKVFGLGHLVGETVGVFADGAVCADKVVDEDGAVTLDRPARQVTIGLQYTSKVRTIRYEGGDPAGSSQGKNSRITKVVVRFLHTLGGWVGYDDDTMRQMVFRTSGDKMGQSPTLFTGDYHMTVDAGFRDNVRIQIEQRQALPMTILAAMPEYEVF